MPTLLIESTDDDTTYASLTFFSFCLLLLQAKIHISAGAVYNYFQPGHPTPSGPPGQETPPPPSKRSRYLPPSGYGDATRCAG